jgi:hypothetical protein
VARALPLRTRLRARTAGVHLIRLLLCSLHCGSKVASTMLGATRARCSIDDDVHLGTCINDESLWSL